MERPLLAPAGIRNVGNTDRHAGRTPTDMQTMVNKALLDDHTPRTDMVYKQFRSPRVRMTSARLQTGTRVKLGNKVWAGLESLQQKYQKDSNIETKFSNGRSWKRTSRNVCNENNSISQMQREWKALTIDYCKNPASPVKPLWSCSCCVTTRPIRKPGTKLRLKNT